MNKWLFGLGLLFICIGVFFHFLPQYLDYKHDQNVQDVVQEYRVTNNHSKNDPVGILTIPSVNIKEPVYEGPATDQQLNKGLSFVSASDSVNDRNIAVAGHRMEGRHIQFNDLINVKKGSDVYFEINHEKRHYKIERVQKVKPNNIDVLDETRDKQLTLITCDDYDNGKWQKRLVYQAKEVK